MQVPTSWASSCLEGQSTAFLNFTSLVCGSHHYLEPMQPFMNAAVIIEQLRSGQKSWFLRRLS